MSVLDGLKAFTRGL